MPWKMGGRDAKCGSVAICASRWCASLIRFRRSYTVSLVTATRTCVFSDLQIVSSVSASSLAPRQTCSAGTRRRRPSPTPDPAAASAPRPARRRPEEQAQRRTMAQRARAARRAARAGSRRATRSMTAHRPRAGSTRHSSRQPTRDDEQRWAGDSVEVARRGGASRARQEVRWLRARACRARWEEVKLDSAVAQRGGDLRCLIGCEACACSRAELRTVGGGRSSR